MCGPCKDYLVGAAFMSFVLESPPVPYDGVVFYIGVIVYCLFHPSLGRTVCASRPLRFRRVEVSSFPPFRGPLPRCSR